MSGSQGREQGSRQGLSMSGEALGKSTASGHAELGGSNSAVREAFPGQVVPREGVPAFWSSAERNPEASLVERGPSEAKRSWTNQARSSRMSEFSSQSQASSCPESRYERLADQEPLLVECRICKEEGVAGPAGLCGELERGERMLKPCRCGGTMAYIHLKCLQNWVERRRLDTSEAALECEVCRSKYRIRIREEVDLSWKRLCSYASLSFYGEFFTIFVTLASMVFLVFLFSKGESKEEIGVLGFVAALGVAGSVLVLGLFTLVKVLGRWRQAMSVPVLLPPSPRTQRAILA